MGDLPDEICQMSCRSTEVAAAMARCVELRRGCAERDIVSRRLWAEGVSCE